MKQEVAVKIGVKLRELRKKYNYTQERLSELSGVDYKHIQRLEGKNPPALRIDTLEKIAKALKTTPAELLR